MKIVVIIPTYNEKDNIGRMLETLVTEEFPQIKNHDMEILVVDSQSPDGTGQLVKDKMKKYKNVELLSTQKEGLGADYVKGMRYAMEKLNAFAVIEFDADFQHDPKDVKRLVTAMDDGADYVIGSRYIPGGAIPKEWGIHRKLMSFFGSLFARVVLLTPKIHDMTSGMKLTKSEFLSKVDLEHLFSKYYAYKIHILHDIVKMGAKVKEIPIIFYERKEGSSKISRKDLIDSFLVVIKLRLNDSKRFIKFGIVGFVGYLVNAFGLYFFSKTALPEWLVWALATEVAIISNFIWNNIWTFKSEKITGVSKLVYKFFQFNLTSAGALVIQPVAGSIGVSILGPQYRQILLPLIIVFLVLPYNYFMYNAVIWRTWKFNFLSRK